MISDRFLLENTGTRLESTGKNPENFRSEYCFHFRCFHAGSGDVPASFLQDPVGSGSRNLRPGKYLLQYKLLFQKEYLQSI